MQPIQRKALAIALAFSLSVLVWELAASSGFVNRELFPGPADVVAAFFEMFYNGELVGDATASISRLFLGLLAGTTLGMLLGIITTKIVFFEESFGQLLNFFRFIPPLALVPLAIVWLGIGESSKIGLIVFASFFPVWIATAFGIKRIDKKHLWAAKSLGAKQHKLLREIIMPAAMPFVMNGTRIALGFGFAVLVAAEMSGAFSGIGFRIAVSHDVFRIDKMIADIILLGFLGLVFDRAFLFVSKAITKWNMGVENDWHKS